MCMMLEEALKQENFGYWALLRTMEDSSYQREKVQYRRNTISFDASPGGGGGVLWTEGKAVQLTHFAWEDLSLQI